MARSDPPTPKQLRELRRLADRNGETFASPTTNGEASAEIKRLRERKPSSRVETRLRRLTLWRHGF